MKHLVEISFVFLALFFAFSSVDAQGFLRAEGKEIVDENGNSILLKGMGLGGWMLQEGYMLHTADFANSQHKLKAKIEELIGTEGMNEFYDAWLQNHVQKVDIDSLKSWGFNSVRLPMHYNLFTLPIEDEPVAGVNTWLDKGFVLTDSLISWCAQNEMYVVLDMHAAPGGQGYDEGISDYDPNKPSIWESAANRDKLASLWKRIAERYVNEPWVAGYDLINEPNWNLPGGTLLKAVYKQCTDSIRAVDQNHILFIEGNWFANDFTGLTPPWDDNFVYSPHKYWSYNDQASIQWVLDMREQYDVPLYLGETGENSNTWFHDAAKLFQEHNIGWAWWPMKKVESISGPLSVVKTEDYQTLLDYWKNGGTAPSSSFAKSTLMDLAEGFKMENCVFQKDVIDALFRQQTTDATIPYRTQDIPGVVYSSDFDMGKNGFAYFDVDVANYNVSTGSFSAWNNGWIYRNDGVDLEASSDVINSNGLNVGWMNTGEWLQFDVNVANTAVYDVVVRYSSNQPGGSFHFETNGASLTGSVPTPTTGGWQNWQSLTVEDVILNIEDKKLRFYVDSEGFNLSSFEFIEVGNTNEIGAAFVSAHTIDESNIQLNINKDIQSPLPATPAGFEIKVAGSAVNILNAAIDPQNPRIINFQVAYTIEHNDLVQISYSGNVIAEDGTDLLSFTNQPVENNVVVIHALPGKVQCEDYFNQVGVQLENTSDIGGGQNIGYLDVGDYLDYYINVTQPGLYSVGYRTAAESQTGSIKLQLVKADGSIADLHNSSFPPTGGWQNWETTTRNVFLSFPGIQHLRVLITNSQFNMNWMEFDLIANTESVGKDFSAIVFPNPTTDHFTLELNRAQDFQGTMNLEIYNAVGKSVLIRNIKKEEDVIAIDLMPYSQGMYYLLLKSEAGVLFSEQLLKLNK